MLEVNKIQFSKAGTNHGKSALGYVRSKPVSADTWHDCGMTLDDRLQVRHKVQIVGWDRERRCGHKVMQTSIVKIARVRTGPCKMQAWREGAYTVGSA